MPSSLSDSSTVEFVGCAPYDTLADASHQYGYQITVGLTVAGVLFGSVFIPDTFAASVHDLWQSLQTVTNDALVPESPEPLASDTRFDTSAHATLSARTLGKAATLTGAELVTLIGQHSPLAVLRVERVSVESVQGLDRLQARAKADASTATASSGLKSVTDALASLGTTAAAAAGVALVVLGMIYFRKR
jgi:hypothetical protein